MVLVMLNVLDMYFTCIHTKLSPPPPSLSIASILEEVLDFHRNTILLLPPSLHPTGLAIYSMSGWTNEMLSGCRTADSVSPQWVSPCMLFWLLFFLTAEIWGHCWCRRCHHQGLGEFEHLLQEKFRVYHQQERFRCSEDVYHGRGSQVHLSRERPPSASITLQSQDFITASPFCTE